MEIIKRLPLILILVCSLASAKVIRYVGQDIEMNDKYSGKSFTAIGLSFKHETDMKNINIYGSIFYQIAYDGEDVVKDIFPDDMENVTFYNCNLDNVYVDEGKNTIVGGTNDKVKRQNDRQLWYLNAGLKPVEPMNKEERLEANANIDPKNIPNKKITQEEKDAFDDSINIPTVLNP